MRCQVRHPVLPLSMQRAERQHGTPLVKSHASLPGAGVQLLHLVPPMRAPQQVSRVGRTLVTELLSQLQAVHTLMLGWGAGDPISALPGAS